MVWKPSAPWTANSTSPYADGAYKGGDRPSGGSGNALYSPFSVEIVQPQAGLDTTSRYYKQYTGLEYNVKVYVRGGDFSALQYSLTTAPSGMVIDADTGVITWANPTEAGSPHNITVQATDGLTSDTVSWTLTVDTTNTIFVDSISGSSANDGSIGSPLSDITDWYGATKGDNTYQGYQVYYRTGTYNVDCIPKNDPEGGVTLSQSKPTVHISYPGETATLDCSLGFWFTDTYIADIYFDDFEIENVGAYPSIVGEGVWFSRLDGNRHVYRRCNFNSIFESSGPNNQAYIMQPFQNELQGFYWGISENYFDAQNQECYALGVFYGSKKCIIESNEVVNCIGIGIGIKINNSGYAIRGNKMAGSGKLFDPAMEVSSSPIEGNAELSWNYGNGGAAFEINFGQDGAVNPIYYIRNTATSQFQIVEWNDPSYGDIYYTHNAIISPTGALYTTTNGVDSGKIVATDNLINTTATGYLDTNTGLLIDSYASQNNTRGHNGLAGLK